jgi:hypothetical protein
VREATIMSFFTKLPLKEQGRIIKVKGVLDYSMSQITQIVESTMEACLFLNLM